jgi:hypothetical protein
MKPRNMLVAVALALLSVAALLVVGVPLAKSIYLEHQMFPNLLSYELRDAPQAPTRRARVQAWLALHRHEIVDAAHRFRINRAAIAGLIAYEGLINVHLSRYAGLAKWSGPGKVHFKENRFTPGDPIAKQVEDMGLLPIRTMRQRERLLKSPKWAALYIAATMRAFADIVKRETHHEISCDSGALVTLDSAWTLRQAAQHFAWVDQHRFVFTYNFAGNWVAGESVMLNRAVGASLRCVDHGAKSARVEPSAQSTERPMSTGGEVVKGFGKRWVHSTMPSRSRTL